MPPFTKTVDGITYTRTRRKDRFATEYIFYWLGSDNSILEFTEIEMAEQDTSVALDEEQRGD